ncbi:hypothetical protein ABIF97_004151 [Bradyrhizobium japonicum]
MSIVYLQEQLARQRKALGELGERVSRAELAERDITKARDYWRDRAVRLEAALRALGLAAD